MEGYSSVYNPAHISSSEAWEMVSKDSDALILDVRSEGSYAERHVSGAINVPYENLAEYAASNIPDKGLIIICYCFCDDKGGSALSASRLLSDLGYSNAYYMEPDVEWTYEGTDVQESPAGNPVRVFVSGAEAYEIYEANSSAILLDVRSQEEYDAGHIGGSMLIPVGELESRLSELPDKDAIIIVYCRAGARSAVASGVLIDNGFMHIHDMGSVFDWPEALIVDS